MFKATGSDQKGRSSLKCCFHAHSALNPKHLCVDLRRAVQVFVYLWPLSSLETLHSYFNLKLNCFCSGLLRCRPWGDLSRVLLLQLMGLNHCPSWFCLGFARELMGLGYWFWWNPTFYSVGCLLAFSPASLNLLCRLSTKLPDLLRVWFRIQADGSSQVNTCGLL